MAVWALLSLALFSYCSGVSSQASITQPASASGSLGQTVTLSCTRSSGSWESFYHWYQQRPGQGPRFVHRPGGSRGEGIPDRFTASGSGNNYLLTITNVEAEDEADYYCGEWESTGGWKFHITPLIRKAKLTMAWALFLLAFLTYCSGVHSQSVTQPASASVSLGQTVKLSCTESSGGSWDYFSWYQQRPGQAPRFLWYGTSSRGEGVPDRFTGSYSGKTGSLTITNAQAEDEADYYCANAEGTGSSFKFHSDAP
ncbi:uncharacterized protein LOC128338014 [Hemicordylus capensis]|uniref:uncharacterized protein LOC128338014 n=1 Tax=Hemicordylus capensis TaxID=884348 RepID=UPI00230391D5|nr:uncharacterized protein LOC128338014 [Hemicordylus capensis]